MQLRGSSLDASLYPLGVISLRDDYEEVRLAGLNLVWALSMLNPEMPLALPDHGPHETVRLIDDAFIMSRLRRKVAPRRERTSQIIPLAEGDFDVESDEFRLLDSGACGAFIHGLEDEFQQVRNASIDTICELCMYNEHLIKKAIESLVDMVNDEIGEVRLNAIHSMRKIGARWPLEFNAENLEITSGTLEDAHTETRHATHDLMAVIRLGEPSLLMTLLDAFSANISQYPQDIILLRTDSRYMTRDPNPEDPTYAMNVILVVNACTLEPKLFSKLPKFVFKHFSYYKIKYPHVIPDLKILFESNAQHMGEELFNNVTVLETAVTARMLSLLQRHTEQNQLAAARLTAADAIKSFQYLAGIKSIEATNQAQLALLYLECYLEALKMKVNYGSPSFGTSGQIMAKSLFRRSYQMQYSFLGLSSWNIQHMITALIRRIDEFQRYFDKEVYEKLDIGILRNRLIEMQERLTPLAIYELCRIIKNFKPLMVDLKNNAKHMNAVITSPVANPDKPFKFNLNHSGGFEIEVELYNSRDVHDIGIEIQFPDKSTRIYWPSYKDFTPTTPYCYKLQANVPIQQDKAWTEPSNVVLRIVRSFVPDLPDLDAYILKYPNATAVYDSRSSFEGRSSTSFVVISKEIQYAIWPHNPSK
ncbi:hypothetical protein BX666DRAFT_1204677 [Dichotomocladium elegans]|nr:hypothetical protein BX666DRAFT_1204677 [Dichotomocladium elegans]